MLRVSKLLFFIIICLLCIFYISPVIGIEEDISQKKLPHIVPIKTENSKITNNYSFILISPGILSHQKSYQYYNDSIILGTLQKKYVSNFSLNASIADSTYYGAKKSARNTMVSPKLTKEENYRKTLPEIINDPYQNEFYEQLLEGQSS